MITLSRSWRDFHFAQQRIHFSVIQLPACPHRSMTGHGCQHMGQPVLQRLAAAKLNQFLGYVAYKLARIRRAQHGRHTPYQNRPFAKGFQLEPQPDQKGQQRQLEKASRGQGQSE